QRMKARTPAIRPPLSATRTIEGPNGLSTCFQFHSASVRCRPGGSPSAARSTSRISGTSAGVADRISKLSSSREVAVHVRRGFRRDVVGDLVPGEELGERPERRPDQGIPSEARRAQRRDSTEPRGVLFLVTGKRVVVGVGPSEVDQGQSSGRRDRKSTRLNSSHVKISYAV